MNADAPRTDQLSFDECWDLLSNDTVGRIAIVVDGHPEIFPVNYALHRRSIVFRTAGGTKLWNAMGGRPTALEIDGYEPDSEMAWSVVARGDTALMQDQADKDAVDAQRLEPWQPGDKDNYVQLTVRALTGRRFKVNRPDIWNTRASDPRRASFE